LQIALQECNIVNDAIHPHYVVVGEGATTMEKPTKAHECIERGARLLATNPDNWCPVSSEKTRLKEILGWIIAGESCGDMQCRNLTSEPVQNPWRVIDPSSGIPTRAWRHRTNILTLHG